MLIGLMRLINEYHDNRALASSHGPRREQVAAAGGTREERGDRRVAAAKLAGRERYPAERWCGHISASDRVRVRLAE